MFQPKLTCLCSAMFLVACGSIEPKGAERITVDQALADLGTGLYRLHANQNGEKYGYMLTDITVTYNVSSDGKLTNTANGKLSVSAPAEVTGGVAVGGSGELTRTHVTELTRGNQITLHFQNPLFATPNTLVYDVAKIPPANGGQPGEQLARIIDVLFGESIHSFIKSGPPRHDKSVEPSNIKTDK